MTSQNSFAKVHLDRCRKKIEISWFNEPAQEDYCFLMSLVKRLMIKYQIQQVVQNNLHS